MPHDSCHICGLPAEHHCFRCGKWCCAREDRCSQLVPYLFFQDNKRLCGICVKAIALANITYEEDLHHAHLED